MMVFCNLFITESIDEINQQQEKGLDKFFAIPTFFDIICSYLTYVMINY